MAVNYCATCGAAINADAEFCSRCGEHVSNILPAALASAARQPHKANHATNTIRMPGPLVFAAGAYLVVLTLILLLVTLYGGLGHAWHQSQRGSSVAYHNMTDQLLCASPSCGAEIKPDATSYWAEDCYSAPIATVEVYTPKGRQLYSRSADCEDWTGEFIVINERDGDFIVVDSLSPKTR
jgi:hypothetical protein